MGSFFWAFIVLASIERGPVPSAHFAVDHQTRVTPTVIATVEPRAGVRGASWIRLYFYAADLTRTEREMAATGRDPGLLRRWDAILQITVDANASVSEMDMALPGYVCGIVQSPRDAAIAVQDFRFDGARLRLKSKAFSVCDLKVEGVPSQRFEWDVTLDTEVVARASSLQ
jgi:hypothetical protein